MNKNILIQEYEKEGLKIIDFHLGLRLAKPMFINTVMSVFIFVSYLIFLFTIYLLVIQPNSQENILLGLLGVFIIFVARQLAKVIAYLYLISFFGLCSYMLFAMNDPNLIIPEIDQILKNTIYSLVFFGIFILAVISMIIVYRTNRNIIIKDGVLSIPASDVEQSILAYIILKPFWGLFYRRDILLEEIISVKNDGYGNKKEDIYPITVTDVNSSNRLIFTSRQKRDEFKTKLSILLGLRDSSGGSFGESE